MRWTAKGPSEVTIKGTEAEIEAVEAMLNGHILLGNPEQSAPLRTSRWHPPNLDPDPEESRFFPPKLPQFEARVQTTFDAIPVATGPYSQERVDKYCRGLNDFEQGCISVYVHGLFGYGCDFTEQRMRCERMRDIGFEQMRSPRAMDGKYWEVWYLPGAWAAQGKLKGAKLADILNFVAREVRPGSIDLVRQQMALCVD